MKRNTERLSVRRSAPSHLLEVGGSFTNLLLDQFEEALRDGI